MSEREPEAIDAGQAIREAFAQWRDTLVSMARPLLGEAGGETDRLEAHFESQTMRLAWARGTEPKVLGVVALSEDDAAHRIHNARAAVPRIKDVSIFLPEEDVLRPVVRLPYASNSNLRKALHYELERLSPVSPDDVYFDFAVLSRDREAGTVEVALRVMRRDIVARAVDLCRAAGLLVSAIHLGADAQPADWQIFPIDRKALLRSTARRFGVALLGGAALLLLLLILLAAYLRGAETAESLADELSTESIHAGRVEHLQHRIDQATTQLAFLYKQKRAPLFVAVLNDVTRTLPDGTWITEFSLSGNKIRIEGYSHAASDLIGVFDRSGRFANAQFAAPVTQGTSAGIERFDLTFEIAGGVR
jgi:general secretion pathway protein L